MKKRNLTRTLLFAVALLLNTLCFHARGAANDDFADAQIINNAVGTAVGDNSAATKETGEPDHGDNAGGSSVWFRWTAPTNGQYLFTTAGSGIDTLLGVYTGASVNALSVEASNDDGSYGLTSAVTFAATIGTTYSVAVDGYDGESGVLVLNWAPVVPSTNDDFADATDIAGSTGDVAGNNFDSTKEAGEPNHAGEPGGSSVWFRWTAPATGQFSFDTYGSSFDTLLGVYTGASVNALTPVASGFSYVSFAATVGTTYAVAVDGIDGNTGLVALYWDVAPAPVIPDFADTINVPFQTLHSFTNGTDGNSANSELILAGNTLYGTAVYGGSSGNGTIFSVNINGTGFTTLHSFDYSNGANPFAGLILAGNMLYGTAWGGGNSGYGTVFAINTNGTGFTNLHRFNSTNGANPYGGVILSGNRLYGTTWYGGSSDNGTVFSLNTNGTGFTNLYSFTASSGAPGTNSDGTVPSSGLVFSGNTLYGTANSGGSSGFGTVFAINTNGTGFINLHNFDWYNDGGYPHAVILSGNTLYGTANGGGYSGNGTVFAVNTDGTGFTNLHSFGEVIGATYTNSHGASPFAGLILSGNTLYGTTLAGGSGANGIVFAMDTNGTSFTTLHSFAPTSGASSTNSDGANLRSSLILSGNTLYGTAEAGGTGGYGTAFSLELPRPHLTISSSGADVILTWPMYAAGFTLESRLVSAATWSTVAPEPTILDAKNTVTNTLSGAGTLYRLKK